MLLLSIFAGYVPPFFIRFSDSSDFIHFIALLFFAQWSHYYFHIFIKHTLKCYLNIFFNEILVISLVVLIDKTYSREILFPPKFQMMISQKRVHWPVYFSPYVVLAWKIFNCFTTLWNPCYSYTDQRTSLDILTSLDIFVPIMACNFICSETN